MGRLALLGLLALVGCGGSGSSQSPDVIFVTLDTIVPEALGCYGAMNARTDAIDSLARDGITFLEARSTAPITLPAHASMLTGLTPARHGVRVNGVTRLAEEAETLAERLTTAGYQTAAFVSAQVLDAQYGLDQGFATFEGPGAGGDESFQMGELPAATTIDRALAWWSARDEDRPAFAWVHLFDPHMPYTAPPEFVARAEGKNGYAAEISYADAQMARLLAAVGDEALVVFIGDHGEAFGRHGEKTHGAFAYDDTLRVPFIVRLPGKQRAGERSQANVSVVDAAPTILSVVGLPPRVGLDGLDVTQPIESTRGVYFESYYGYSAFGWSPMAGWLEGGWKFVQAPRPELFQIPIDRAEATNLFEREPERAAFLRARLEAAVDAPALPVAAIAPDADHEAILARLGYAGGGVDAAAPKYPTPFEHQELPSPHTRATFLAAFGDAQALYERGQPELAMSKLREILTDNSRNHSAQQLAGLCLMKFKQWEPAAVSFQSAMRYREGPWAGGWLNLGVCLDNMGNHEAALQAYLRSHGIAPLPESARPRVRALLRKAGRGADVEALLGAGQ